MAKKPSKKPTTDAGAQVELEVSAETSASSPEAPVTSFEVFELCIARARNLLKLHEKAHGKQGKPAKFAADAHRAAIVLAISALDAFTREFVMRQIIKLLADPKTLPSALAEKIKQKFQSDQLLEAARKGDLSDRVEKAFRSEFDKRSFQGTKNIEEGARLAGFEDLFHEVAMLAQMNEDSLRDGLDRFTQRRHEIAHRGDYDLGKRPPKERVVTKKDANDCITLVGKIARHMHELETR